MDLFIKSIIGQEEMLTDFEVTRKDAVNGDKYINVSIVKTEKNEHSFRFVVNENIFIYDNEEYVIKQHKESILGMSTKIECTAIHRMFDDLKNNYIYEIETGTKRLDFLMNFALANSGYTFSLITDGLPLSVSVENFGDDNSLALFKSILDKFGAEFEINGTHITVKKHVGSQTDSQFRYKYNLSNPSKDINTDSFATYIRGYGKQNEDGTYMAQVEYTSPLAEIFDIKHAKPIRDDRFTKNQELLDFCIRSLNDNIEMSIQLTYVQLKEMGIEEINKGDYVWCILDPFGIDIKIRVLEIEDYSNQTKSPVFTLGTITKKATDIMASFNATKNKIDKVITDDGTIKYTFLDSSVKQVTEALQSAQTELEFVNGIIARDKENPNNIVLFNSAGVGVSTDGGETFKTAMTAEAIVSFRIIGSDIEGGTITGSIIRSESNDDTYTHIEGGYLDSRGQYNRTWLGESSSHDVSLRLQNGYFRARNNTLDRSLYFSDFGLSTYIDGQGEFGGSSGSLLWWDKRYSPSGANGFTINSHGGVVALESDLNRIVLNAELSVNLESRNGPVYVRPYRTNKPGNNVFNFTLSDGETSTDIDGFLMYGSDINDYGVGLRMSKTGPIISVVDENFERGGDTTFDVGNVRTNSIKKRDGTGGLYWNGSGTGTTAGGTLDNTLFATAVRTNDSNFYIATDLGGSVHVTNYAGYNNGQGITYRPIYASEFNPASSVLYKDNVELFDESGVDIVKDHQVFTYFLKSDLEEGIYDNKQIGFIAEASPMLRKGNSVSLSKSVAISWKAIQELIERLEVAEQKIIDLEIAG